MHMMERFLHSYIGKEAILRELEYPFDSEYILKKSKRIRRELLANAQDEGKTLLPKKIAVLGGSTTHDIIRILDLFLLNQGIEAEFYESEYAQYWQDVMFDNPELIAFAPDLIYVHTTSKNISMYPEISDTMQQIEEKLQDQYAHFEKMWKKLETVYGCQVIQNNFEYPSYRLLGNREAYDAHGRINFINKLNAMFADYAGGHDNFFIHDINYVAAAYGLDEWADSAYWHMYKYAMSMQAIPEFAFNLSHIVKAIFGKNKKALALDLDNTLWGGVVGDDGPENLELGQETSLGQVYQEFQTYLKAYKDLGILLNINSKNDYENAIAGLTHPDGILKPEDFIVIKANWDTKSQNLIDIAQQLNIGKDALVFVDDNPREREIICQQVPEAAVPELTVGENLAPDQFIHILDKNGYFEVINLSEDDKKRNDMYKANALRKNQEESFGDYKDFLKSLDMKGIIKPFEPVYYSRIAQLTNKSNQFNLTTKRLSQAEIEQIAQSSNYITLYGKLEDKFGDNGVVSLLIGRKENDILHIDLWLMSCRVLKKDMEFAMLDALVDACRNQGIHTIKGYYYKTAKNVMVKDFYSTMGFEKTEDGPAEGDSQWVYEIPKDYVCKNEVIVIN